MLDTKPNLNSSKFEQSPSDVLNLSGVTNFITTAGGDLRIDGVSISSLTGSSSGGSETNAANGLIKVGNTIALGGILTGATVIDLAGSVLSATGGSVNFDTIKLHGSEFIRGNMYSGYAGGTVIGHCNGYAGGYGGTAVGFSAYTTGCGTAVGALARAGFNSASIGYKTCSGGYSTVVGNSSTGGSNSIVIGRCSSDNDLGNSILIGNNARASCNCGISIGLNSKTCGIGAISIGHSSCACTCSSVALGRCARTCGPLTGSTNGCGIAIGFTSRACNQGIGIGVNASACGCRSIAIGCTAIASGSESLSIGRGNCVAATALGSAIIGGSGSTINTACRTTLIGVNNYTVSSTTYSCHAIMPNLALTCTPQTGNATMCHLVRDPVTGQIKQYVGGGGVTGLTVADNGLSIVDSTVILGGNLTGATTICGHSLKLFNACLIVTGGTASTITIHKNGSLNFGEGPLAKVLRIVDTNGGQSNVLLGKGITYSGYSITAIGSYSSANGVEATVVGSGSYAAYRGTAIGAAAQANDDEAIAIGRNASGNGVCAIGIGVASAAYCTHGIAIGGTACSCGGCAIALGRNGLALCNCSLAIGFGAQSRANNSIAVGMNARVCGAGSCGSIVIGTGSTVTSLQNVAVIGNGMAISNAALVHHTVVRNLAICTTPVAGNSTMCYLVRDSSTGAIKQFSGATGGGTTENGNNGLSKRAGNNIGLGGTLTGATTITSATACRLCFAGWPLQYTTDLSANFSAGSIVDKRYVTGITTTLVTTANNGITKSGTNFRLGGTLTGTTLINATTSIFNLSGTTGQLNAFRTTGSVNVKSRNAINIVGVSAAGVDQSSLKISATGATFTDARATQVGLQYAANYGSTFAVRSLVDKGYVTGITSTLTSTANNGITKSGTNFRLGGLLTGNTTITGATACRLNFGGWPVQYATDLSSNFGPRSLVDKSYVTGLTTTLGTTANNGITKSGTNFRLGGSLTGNTTITGATACRLNFSGWPVQYETDLSANFGPRSLVDKGYVTGITSGFSTVTANNGLTKSGSNIHLGGALTGNTLINACGNNVAILNGGTTKLLSDIVRITGLTQTVIGAGSFNDATTPNASLELYCSIGSGTFRLFANTENNTYSGQLGLTALETDSGKDSLGYFYSPGSLDFAAVGSAICLDKFGRMCLSMSNELQINGDRGLPGQVPTSQGDSLPPIWAFVSGSSSGGTALASNGLSNQGDYIVLGGSLTGNTVVDTNNFGIAFGSSSATGLNSFAEGQGTCALGDASHAEGQGTCAIGEYSHAEGRSTIAYCLSSHSEGGQTRAAGYASHAEGLGSCAVGSGSHAEGNYSCAIGNYSHAQGMFSKAFGVVAHAEGCDTIAFGYGAHAQNRTTAASGDSSHAGGLGYAFGKKIISYGIASFNHSVNNNAQVAGHGALASGSTIIGGVNHNIETGNVRAAIVGGYSIKLTGTTYVDTTAVANLAIMSQPQIGDAEMEYLVRHPNTGVIYSVIGGSSGSSFTFNNGICNYGLGVIGLGGQLNGSTTIDADGNNFTLSNACAINISGDDPVTLQSTNSHVVLVAANGICITGGFIHVNTVDGEIIMLGVPTTLPILPNRLWSDGGNLCLST